MFHIKWKRFSALALSACLALTAVPSFSAFASDSGTLNGAGTKADPYLIESASDLHAFAEKVASNKKASAKLTTDVEVASWEPIAPYNGSSEDAYLGVFDGGNHQITISGSSESSAYQGLFGYNKGTIKNLTVNGTISGTESAAGIASVNRGTIDNCSNTAAISTSGEISFSGGIAGTNFGTIKNSKNSGTITANQNGAVAGGIAGAAAEGSIRSVSNTGSVNIQPSGESEVTEYQEASAGGIAGINYNGTIEIAENNAAITNTDAEGYTGGIVGINNGTIKHTLNSNTITGSYYSGGIAGYLFKNTDAGEAFVSHSFNHGMITADSAKQSSGAICGRSDGGTAVDNYYLNSTSSSGLPNLENGAIAKSLEEVENGSVTYLLNGESSANPIWKQTIGNGSAPGFQSADTVYASYSSESEDPTYTNTKPEHSEADHHYDETGTCKICGHHSVKAVGHSLTLDGSIGVNFYYYIDHKYRDISSDYTVEVEFTVNGKTSTVAYDANKSLQIDGESAFGFTASIDSDEMTFPITSKLKVKKDEKVLYTVKQEPYRVYDYLLKVIDTDPGKAAPAAGGADVSLDEKLTNLAKSLATYDYYSTEYFQYHEPYEEETKLLSLDGITQETLAEHKWMIGAYDQDSYTYKHYASSLQFKTTTNLLMMAQVRTGREDTGNLYLGYKIKDSEDAYKYVKAKKVKNGNTEYYQASIDSIPSSELGTVYDMAFFQKANDTYTQVTPVKTGSAYSYLYTLLGQSSSNNASKNLAKAFYLYAEAAKNYFSSIQN